jgi:hypothetical protein
LERQALPLEPDWLVLRLVPALSARWLRRLSQAPQHSTIGE